MEWKEATGTTTVSRVKTLALHVQRHRGRDEADEFLLETKLDRDYLEDETRPIPIETWHAAAQAFASRFSREEIERVVPEVVSNQNLGVWTRLLRGTNSPADAYGQFSFIGGEDTQTERWHGIEEGPRQWLLRLPLLHDPAHERDGLLAAARGAELAAVPLLFGLAPARVKLRRSNLEGDSPELEYEVSWAERGRVAPVAGGVLGAALGAALSPLIPAVELGVVAGLACCALGVAAGHATRTEQQRRTVSHGQMLRIQALERAATLRENRERGSVGLTKGVVVAGQYRLGQQLGVGASGAIFEATRLADGALVAIKLLRTPVAQDSLAADRLRREAAALGLTWHPNVVEVYDDGHLADGTSYLVLERLYGETLAVRLRRMRCLTHSEILSISLQICDALEAVHAAGVIHRDLKPSNIFLSKPGPGALDPDGAERVKLLDFGVARIEWAETRITNMGVPIGTPGYMAPEQEEGGDVDPRSDLYALGAVLYQCLVGEAPPVHRQSHVPDAPSDPPSGVQRAAEPIPPAWQNFLDRTMTLMPEHRYPDARAAKDALLALDPDAGQEHRLASKDVSGAS